MMKRLLLVTLAVTATSLTACGPGAKIGGGKQGAAEALYAATGPTKASADRAATPLDLTAALTVKCPDGGEASLTGFSIDIGIGTSTSVSQSFTLNYKNCGLATSSAGTAVYNGSLTVSQVVKAGSGTASVEQGLKGKVAVQGAFDDFVQADVSQSVVASAIGSGGGSVAMHLKGTIATSSGSYTFDEDLTITAHQITAELKK